MVHTSLNLDKRNLCMCFPTNSYAFKHLKNKNITHSINDEKVIMKLNFLLFCNVLFTKGAVTESQLDDDGVFEKIIKVSGVTDYAYENQNWGIGEVFEHETCTFINPHGSLCETTLILYLLLYQLFTFSVTAPWWKTTPELKIRSRRPDLLFVREQQTDSYPRFSTRFLFHYIFLIESKIFVFVQDYLK